MLGAEASRRRGAQARRRSCWPRRRDAELLPPGASVHSNSQSLHAPEPPGNPLHLRHRRRRLRSRQGHRRRLDRPAARRPRPVGDDPEVRPVHQRRPGHDEPVPARRGVRHRGRRRDRPRPRPLRALHRRQHQPRLERHRRRDLRLGDPARAPRRLPRRHRPGDPAHHRRDQEPHPAGRGVRRRRHRDHRDRRHGRRHRVAAVPRGAAPVPGRPRAATAACSSTSRWCRSSATPAS